MRKCFSIMIDNRAEAQGNEGRWFWIADHNREVQEAMREIHISTDNLQDFFIADFPTRRTDALAIPYDMVLAADVDELNFLAARLDTLDAAALAELNAALQNPRGGFESIGRSSTMPTTWTTMHLPDVQSPGQLGTTT